MTDPAIIYSATEWERNANLIADCAKLGYLHEDWLTLDPTYGLGNFYTKFRPKHLIANDLYVQGDADFTALPYKNGAFQAVVFDPPYKLNGTPTDYVDGRYGVARTMRWQERMELIDLGFRECIRVLARKGFLLAKCKDQVCSGHVRWQTDMLSEIAARYNLEKFDRLEFLNIPRPQDRPQKHSRRNYSTFLVFRRK